MVGNTARLFLEKSDFLDFCQHYINYEVDHGIIIVNPETVSWVLLTSDEYQLLRSLQEGNDQEGTVEEIQQVFMKMLVNSVIRFKNNIKEAVIAKPKISVYFEPTPYCNLRCVYCYAEAGPPATPTGLKANTSSTLKLLDNILSTSVDSIYFTGGEATLRKDIFELADYVKRKGVGASLLTNGTLITKQNVEKFKIFDKITISLDASMASVNDITRGKGTFDKIVSAIKLLKSESINVSVTSVVSKANFSDVPELLKFVRHELDVKQHKVTTYVSHGRGKENADCMECSYNEILRFRSEYIDFLINENEENEVLSLLQPQINKGLIRTVCGVASSEVFIDNNGQVFPCRLFGDNSYVLGNLNNNSLEEILQNENTKDFQSKLYVNNIESCSKCDVKNLCGGGCRSSHACYTGDINKSHPELCKIIKEDIRNAILLNCGYNPLTLKSI